MKTQKIPERMCVACRNMKPKKELLRVLKTPEDKIVIDITGRQNGRGAYLCKDEECLNKALKNKALERALKVKPDEEIIQQISELISGKEHD